MSELLQLWQGQFDKTPPLAHVLRSSYPDRWVRFHTLPASKRYPSTASEMTEVIARLNAISRSIFEDLENCWLIFAEEIYSQGGKIKKNIEIYDSFYLEYFHSDSLIDSYGDKTFWNFYATRVEWAFLELHTLFEAISADRVSQILWISTDSHNVFAPYDGGVDVILNSHEERDCLREKFHHWLSAEPSGL